MELQKLLSDNQQTFNQCLRWRGDAGVTGPTWPQARPTCWKSPYMQAVHVMAPATLLGEIVELRISEALPNSLSAVLAAPDAAGRSMQENGRLAV